MQISDVTKNGYYINKSYSSMIPLIRILKIFAINWNVDQTRSKASILIQSFCTSVILGVLNFTSLYYKINYVYIEIDISIELTDMAQVISDFGQYIVDLYFVYKYGRNVCVDYFKQYQIIDKFLDIKYYSVMKRKLLKRIAFFITIWIISSLGDLGAWVITYGWGIPISHSVSYLFLLIKMLTTLDLIAHATQIETRLKMFNNLVQKCYTTTDAFPVGHLTECVYNINWLCQEYEDDTIPDSPQQRSTDSYEIKRLTKCYLLLTEQVAFINKLYGFRILLNTASLLLDMVKILNTSIRIAIGTQRTLNNGRYHYLPGISGIMRLLTCAAVEICLVDQCEQTYRQREQIINVINHLLINKNPDKELQSALEDLKTLLQERPIFFNMANFFTLNYSLLMSIASVVVTYTIILLQSVN